MQREICFLRYWNTLLRAQNFKPKFELQTSLARNSPVGTSELLSFDSNSDLPWDWRFPEILLGDFSLISPVGVYHASTFLGNCTGLRVNYSVNIENYFSYTCYQTRIFHSKSAILIVLCLVLIDSLFSTIFTWWFKGKLFH